MNPRAHHRLGEWVARLRSSTAVQKIRFEIRKADPAAAKAEDRHARAAALLRDADVRVPDGQLFAFVHAPGVGDVLLARRGIKAVWLTIETIETDYGDDPATRADLLRTFLAPVDWSRVIEGEQPPPPANVDADPRVKAAQKVSRAVEENRRAYDLEHGKEPLVIFEEDLFDEALPARPHPAFIEHCIADLARSLGLDPDDVVTRRKGERTDRHPSPPAEARAVLAVELDDMGAKPGDVRRALGEISDSFHARLRKGGRARRAQLNEAIDEVLKRLRGA
jgi:hypothetical protein